jgi:hypothetical protein
MRLRLVEETIYEDIIQRPSPPIHADPDAFILRSSGVVQAGEW